MINKAKMKYTTFFLSRQYPKMHLNVIISKDMDLSKITNPEAKRFINAFFADREINCEFYKRVPEDKFDYRMVDTKERKSDSPRESLVHQIDTQRDYVNAIKTGKLEFGVKYDDLKNPQKLSKQELLKKLEKEDQRLVSLLENEGNCKKLVKVPWSQTPIPVVSMLWALDSHEILHTGWNLALMDHLNIERFPALKRMWG